MYTLYIRQTGEIKWTRLAGSHSFNFMQAIINNLPLETEYYIKQTHHVTEQFKKPKSHELCDTTQS